MLYSATLVAPPQAVFLPESVLAAAFEPLGARPVGRAMLGPMALDLTFEAPEAVLGELRRAARATLEHFPLDICVQPAAGRRKRLLISDMDSTIVACECIDELADFMDLKAEIAAITERGMRGEIDFETGLRQRVAMLKGLPQTDIDRCILERVTLNPGAEIMVRTMAANGAACLLVSGGFTLFVDRVARDVGFHRSMSNVLEIEDGRLTGGVLGTVFGSRQKRETLQAEASAAGLDLSQTLAVGDGANDLGMIEAAGLGVAYRAKPLVADRAAARIDHTDLTSLLYFQGYRFEEFVS